MTVDPSPSRWAVARLRGADGDLARARLCRLPRDFARRLETDVAALRRQTEARAAERGGELIDATVVEVDTVAAFHRVIATADGAFVMSLLIPVGPGIEVQVVCFDDGEFPGRRKPMERAMTALHDLPIIKLAGTTPPRAPRSAQRLSHTRRAVRREGFKHAIYAARFSQEAFARALGVSDDTVSRWVNGVYTPDQAQWPTICDVLEVSSRELGRLLAGWEYADAVDGGAGTRAQWVIDPARLDPPVSILTILDQLPPGWP